MGSSQCSTPKIWYLPESCGYAHALIYSSTSALVQSLPRIHQAIAHDLPNVVSPQSATLIPLPADLRGRWYPSYSPGRYEVKYKEWGRNGDVAALVALFLPARLPYSCLIHFPGDDPLERIDPSGHNVPGGAGEAESSRRGRDG